MKQGDKIRLKDQFKDMSEHDKAKKYSKVRKGHKEEIHVSDQYSDWQGRSGQIALVLSAHEHGQVILWPDGVESFLHNDDIDDMDVL